MFVYSIRSSTLKFIAAITLSVAVLLALVFLVPAYTKNSVVEASDTISYSGIKTNEDRMDFLSKFGWDVNSVPVTEEKVTIPSEFDAVFAGYNDLQRQQGLDLSKYKRKTVDHYTYEIKNYQGYDKTVWANLLVYRGKVVAGDISSADPNGFVHGFSKD